MAGLCKTTLSYAATKYQKEFVTFLSFFSRYHRLSVNSKNKLEQVDCEFQVQVVFPTLVTGNLEEYIADAKTFKPARWLKDNENEKLHPFASLPYGYGARMCLGRRFADLEMQVLLAKVK